MPEDKNDQEYQRQFFQTTIDLEKIFEGAKGSYVTKTLVDLVAINTDFELKFPMTPVCLQNEDT
jgi:hypothetical protein